MEVQLVTKDNERHAFVFENNDLGVKAMCAPQRDGKFAAEVLLDAQLTIDGDEGRTLVWALEAYRDKILADIADLVSHRTHHEDTFNEDLAFLGLILQRATQLLYTLQEDHEGPMKALMNCWMNYS